MNTQSNNNPSFDPDELRSLIDAMCDGVLEEQQAARLEAIIASDEEAMEFYIETMWMNESIARHSAGDSSKIDQSVFPIGNQADPALDSKSQQTDLNVGAEPMSIAASQGKPVGTSSNQKIWSQPNEVGSRGSAWALGLGIACLLALMASLAVLWTLADDGGNGNNATPSVVAHNGPPNSVGKAKDAIEIPKSWNQNASTEKNEVSPSTVNEEADTLLPTDSEQQSDDGLVAQDVDTEKLRRTELSDGTIVIARPGAKFSVEKSRELRLDKGELYLIVAKSETPFVVKTNDGEVHATGTRFSVSAADKTHAAVAQGTVILKSSISDIALGAGQKGTLIKSETPTRGPAKRISHLVNWAKEALAQDELLVETLPRENGLVAIDPYGQEAKLSLRKYNVDVYIEDGVARTTIDQTFFNHNPWNTEGTFYFPLPQDASVARLAMYVFGKLNEGGMVTRQRGQEIYTDILYQRRDPALLEMMEGNMFKMRIFPLEGRQEKRIFLSYTQNLEELYGATKYFFPMEHTNDITQELSIRVHIKDGAKQYDPKSSTHDLKSTIDGDDLVLEYDAQKIKPDQDFLLNLLPQTEKPESEVRVAVCEKDGQHYISAKLNPELTGVNQPEPRQWIVLNDVSASRSDIDIQAQRYVLNRLVTEADDKDSVFLIDVNTVARNISHKPFNVRSVNIKPILNHRPEHVIGATNLGAGFKAAAEVIRKHKLDNPHILYLGDGVATDGEKTIADLPRLIPRNCKFVGVGIGKKVDSLFLQEAANRTGGTFANINPNEDIDWRVFDLLASINTPRMTNIKVELLDDGGGLMEAIAYPSSSVLAAGETLTVTAMSDKSLPSSIRFQGRVGTELVTKTADVKEAKTDAQYLPRLWAKRHIDELLKSDMSDKEEIISLSKDFYVVTPHTSLIVLEDDAMYKEYDVQRGRKDHWASYDAPKTIEVIKEPLERNDRWWGSFEGEESKIDVKVRPKTAQEIVDNIQIRINAPFYIWNDQTQYDPQTPSRIGLYRLCNRDTSGKSDPSDWLTLYYLLAAGDREAAVDWSQSVAATSGSPPVNGKPGYSIGMTYEHAVGNDKKSSKSSGKLASNFFSINGCNPFSTAKNISVPVPRLGIWGQTSDRAAQRGLSFDFGLPLHRGGRALSGRSNKGKTVEKRKFVLRPSLAGGAPTSLSPEVSRSVAQAIGKRWSRLERDVEKYNSQRDYGCGVWNRGDSIDARDLSNHWYGSQISEILDGPQQQAAFDDLPDDAELSPQIGFDIQRPFGNGFDGDGYGYGFDGAFGGNGLIYDTWASVYEADEDSDGQIDSNWIDLGLELTRSPARYRPIDQAKLARDLAPLPQMYLAASRQPIQDQPGMTAILAADHLSKRLSELERLASEQPDGLDKKQLAQQRAMQVAIKNIERAGARLEQSGQFWGYQGWSYYLQPKKINPPKIQLYNGSQWSLDLTRYAAGLYSNTNDMIEEVAKQYGSPKPLGKIDDQSREKIELARSNFKPVEIQFEQDGTKFYVGPDNKFAFSSTSDMYLTEQLVCDGQQIVQIYDEIGIAARRSATQTRLSGLRQLAPHMIPDVDSMIGRFDVELVESDEQSTTIKLTIAEPEVEQPESEAEGQKNDTQDNEQPETEDQIACLVVKFDNQGRVLSRQLLLDDEQMYTLDLSYDDNKVTFKWKIRVQPETDEESETGDKEVAEVASFESGESSYRCKELQSGEANFTIELDDQVVIDMPLMKPEFYEKQIQKIEKTGLKILTTDGRVISGTGIKNKDNSWTVTLADGERVRIAKSEIESVKQNEVLLDRETTLELISLYHHFSVSKLQDFTQQHWISSQHLHKTIPMLKKLKKHAQQKYKKGELTILGATRSYQPKKIIADDEVHNFEWTPLFQFINAKRNHQTHLPLVNGEIPIGLIQHVGLYDWVIQNSSRENVQLFRDRFSDSPLTLALICRMGRQEFQTDELLKLNEDPRWKNVALLAAANLPHNGGTDDMKIAAAFWKWQEQRAEDDLHPILVDSLLERIKKVDPERVTKFLSAHLDSLAKLDSLPALIDLTERIGGLGGKELSDRGFELIRERLKIDSEENPSQETPLLHRFAYAQALWAGSRGEESLEQYELILAELEKKQIQPSPGFIATMARLCYHTAEHARAFELEERALAMEHPYLPNAINLQAFRQRYQWLWKRYQEALDKIHVADPERSKKVDDLVDRASATWRRWIEVDRDNAKLPTQMATLLKKAGRDEQAWEYLSTSIDKRPRDASTYQSLGIWYRQHGDLETASNWYKQAPQWDTANPQWIMTYANSLKELGKKKEAKLEYQKIIDGKWAPGLQHFIRLAKKELDEL